MSAKVIKLQDNNNNTLLPVTDASLVQMTVGTETKSVQDVILEDEEVTAAGYNELNNRVTALEGADMSNYITQDELSSNSYVTQTSLSSNSYVTQTSLSANGYLTNLNNQSKDFGKVQTITDDTGTGAGTTTKGTMNADAVKDVLQVKGGNKWITTGVSNTTAESTSDNDILVINHAINPSGTATNATLSGTEKGTFGSTEYLTALSYSVDAAGHISSITGTKAKLPTPASNFGQIKNNVSGLKDIITYTAPLTTAGTATADAPQDTLNVYASNYWIRTNVTDTSNTDVLTVGHSLATNTAKYTSQTLYGNESIISTSYGFDAAGHRTTTYNTTYTLSLDASYINITYNETTKSVKDVILENEEITAIALNELNDRVDDTIETVESIAPLIVNISPALSINGIKCDASIDDIQDAYYAGRNVIARTVDGQLNLVQCNSSSVIFTNSHTNTIIYYIGSKVNNSDQWTITTTSLDDYKLKTVYLDLTSTTSGNTTTYYLQLNGVTQTYSQIESIYNTGADIKVRTSLNPSSSNEKIVICDLIARNTTQGSFMWHALVNAVLVIPLIFISIGTSNTVSVVTGDLANLQEKLISGTNIKTINSQSLLSSGDIALQTPLTFDNTPTANSNNPVKSGGVKTYVDDSFKNSMLFLKCITNSTQQGAIMQVTSSVTPIEGSIITIYFTHDVPASARLSINGETAKYIQTAISNNNYLDIVSDTIKAYDTATFLKLEDIYYLINVNSIARPNLTSKFIVPSNGAVSLDGSTAAKKIIPNKVYYVASGGESSFTPITSLNIGNNAIINSDSIYSDVTIGTTELTPYEDFIVPVYQIFFKTGSSCSITLGNKMIWKDNLAPASSDLSNKYCELTIMNKIATLISVDIPT